MILILGGTGTYFLDLAAELGAGEFHSIATPYGASGRIYVPERWNDSIALASRHGWGKLEVSPPFVNSRALIWAARELDVTHILSWNGVGAINRLLQVHDLVVLDGVLDGTKTRPLSFNDQSVPHDRWRTIQHPFDAETAAVLADVARRQHDRTFPVGIYACSEGPRLETAAEIAMWQRLGAEVVGMTLVPEVFLARELGIKFASLAYITNFATGVEPAAGAPRFFGVEVAQRCLQIVADVGLRLKARG